MKTFTTSLIAKCCFVTLLVLGALCAHSQCTVVTPGLITGIRNVCGYVGTGDQLTYSIDPLTDATSYQWVIPPNTTLVSGQGTTSIIVTFNNGYIPQANHQIRVRAIFPCGISSYRVFYTTTQPPNTPSAIIAGATNICAFLGTANAVSYTINAVPGATSYFWTAPSLATIIHPNGPGVNDTTVLLTFPAGFIGSLISVIAINDCGASAPRSFYIAREVPSTPGLIAGPTNVCSYINAAGTFATYSIVPVSAATLYTWTAPAGSIVSHPNGAGPNDLTIQVLFPFGFTNGAITVSATNGCGTSGTRSQAVSILPPSAPGVITATSISGCPDRVYTYSLASIPLNCIAIEWTVPLGGIIISGQGTTLLTVDYGSNPASGNVIAVGVSNCGLSAPRTFPVNLPQCRPATPSSRYSTIMQEGSAMALQVSPNPSAGEFKLKLSTIESIGINIRILDVFGRTMKTINAKPNETISFGNELKPGNYFIEVTQGNTRKIERLVKL